MMPTPKYYNWLLAALPILLVNIPAGNAYYNLSVMNKAPISTPGGSRYANEIGGDEYSLFAMSEAADIVLSVLGVYEPKPVVNTNLIIEKDINIDAADEEGWGYVSNISNIHISARYIAEYEGPDVRSEFAGMIQHCTTLVWLWNGEGQAPAGLLTGIASFMRAYAGLSPVGSTMMKLGGGERWDQGYEVTANFLIYCEALRHRFVPELNKKMKYGYADGFFHELTGKTVAQLWKDYKAEYGTTKLASNVSTLTNSEISY